MGLRHLLFGELARPRGWRNVRRVYSQHGLLTGAYYTLFNIPRNAPGLRLLEDHVQIWGLKDVAFIHGIALKEAHHLFAAIRYTTRE